MGPAQCVGPACTAYCQSLQASRNEADTGESPGCVRWPCTAATPHCGLSGPVTPDTRGSGRVLPRDTPGPRGAPASSQQLTSRVTCRMASPRELVWQMRALVRNHIVVRCTDHVRRNSRFARYTLDLCLPCAGCPQRARRTCMLYSCSIGAERLRYPRSVHVLTIWNGVRI